MSDWTEHAEHLTSEESLDNLEPEPPTRCGTCGRSMYLADHDNDGICDDCWEKGEKVSFEENQRRQRELAKRGVPFS